MGGALEGGRGRGRGGGGEGGCVGSDKAEVRLIQGEAICDLRS